VKRTKPRAKTSRPAPPRGPKPSTVFTRRGPSTVPRDLPAKHAPRPHPRRRAPTPVLSARRTVSAPKRQAARIIDEDESSVLDLLDNLLSKGVMLNADLILALADVDLVYIRLSALLCAADRVRPPAAR
jgi:hypothetical protein